jgi:hypothetical protein
MVQWSRDLIAHMLGVFQPARIDVDETVEHVIISLYVRWPLPEPAR